jgi:hypothetical protein
LADDVAHADPSDDVKALLKTAAQENRAALDRLAK